VVSSRTKQAAVVVGVLGVSGLAAYLLWLHAQGGCPKGDVPAPCPNGYIPDPAFANCCMPQSGCPAGEVEAPCPSGYIPDPANPGCCVDCAATTGCGDYQVCPNVNPACLQVGKPLAWFPQVTTDCDCYFDATHFGGLPIYVAVESLPAANGATPRTFSVYDDTAGLYLLTNKTWPAGAETTGLVAVETQLSSGQQYAFGWHVEITYSDGTVVDSNELAVKLYT